MRASALVVAVGCVVSVFVSGCGDSKSNAFTIGILSDCYGPAGGSNEVNVASAELPLVERGATSLGRNPSDGIAAVEVAGRRVRLVLGCVAGTGDVIPEARRLVEEDGARVIVGPQDPSQGMALRLYARRRPGTAFLIQPSAAPELTLTDPARNVFRFTLDAAQSNAGLGGHAYRRLRWRKAAIVADDVPYAWEQAAGFVAEFCALGGRVVDAIWVPFGMDPAAAAARVPRDVDGVYLAQAILPMSAFLKRYAALGHDLADHVVASAEVVADPGAMPSAVGLVVGGGSPLEQATRERAYARRFASLPEHGGAGDQRGIARLWRRRRSGAPRVGTGARAERETVPRGARRGAARFPVRAHPPRPQPAGDRPELPEPGHGPGDEDVARRAGSRADVRRVLHGRRAAAERDVARLRQADAAGVGAVIRPFPATR
jgi:hypothetical protein